MMATTMGRLLRFLLFMTAASRFRVNAEEIARFDSTLSKICENFVHASGVNNECTSQLKEVCNDQGLFLKMADAWSKIPYTGMLYQAPMDMGTYDECVAIDYQSAGGVRLLGKHCAMGLQVPISVANYSVDVALAYCVPDQCAKSDVAKLLGLEGDASALVNDMYCTTKEYGARLEGPGIAILMFVAIIVGFMIISTVYDVYLYTHDMKTKHPLLTAFSVFSNGRKLLQTSSGSKDQILAFHGIKFISMIWVVAGHNGVAWSMMPIYNIEFAADYVTARYSQYIQTGHLAVDTFFYLSGFLLAYLYFKEHATKSLRTQIFSIPYQIVHRYLRLTPAMIVVVLYLMYVAKYLGSGPAKEYGIEGQAQSCRDNWWAVLLYIQNYHNRHELCITSLWYLSVDMQLFLVAPVISIPIAMQYRSHFRRVMIELGVLNVIFTLLPIWTKLQFKDYDPGFEEFDTHSRLVVYFMGFMWGLYIRHGKHNPHIISTGVSLCLWFLTLGTMFGVVMMFQEATLHYDYTARAVTNSLLRPTWSLGLCWIVYACFTGKGGIINWFLSAPFFQVLSKLTYCMYLTHAQVVSNWAYTTRYRQYFNDWLLFYSWCGHIVVTLLVSLFWTLAFESPLITVEKYLMGGRSRTKKAPHQHPKV